MANEMVNTLVVLLHLILPTFWCLISIEKPTFGQMRRRKEKIRSKNMVNRFTHQEIKTMMAMFRDYPTFITFDNDSGL